MTTKLLADLLKQSLWVKNSLLKTPLWSIVLSSNVQPNRDCGLRYTTPYILYYTYNAHETTFFDDDETAGRSVETISESRTRFVQKLVSGSGHAGCFAPRFMECLLLSRLLLPLPTNYLEPSISRMTKLCGSTRLDGARYYQLCW